MTGSKYRLLRKSQNKDDKRKAKRDNENKNYSNLKADLVAKFVQFNSNDDLFDLVEAIRSGVLLLEYNEFPINEFKKYENRKK